MVTAPWCRALVCSLVVAPVVLLGSGCKTASGWRTPWSNWGGASSPNATALNISKPSTQAPAPNIPGQPNRSIAASGGANASGVATVGANAPATGAPGTNSVAGYPATPHAFDVPSQPGTKWQPGAGSNGPVAPAGGMQVGPYPMGSQPPASGYAGGAPRGNADAGSPAVGPYGSTEGYRTANTGNHAGAATSATTPTEDPAANSAGSVYGGSDGAATANESNVYGPAEETSPAAGGYAPAGGPASGAEPSSDPTTSGAFGPPNTVAPGARPANSPTSSSGSGKPALPSSLSNTGGYRPGSTGGGFSTRNAAFEQPQNPATPDDASAGEPVYR